MGWKDRIGQSRPHEHPTLERAVELMPDLDPRWLGKEWVIIRVDEHVWRVSVQVVGERLVRVRRNGSRWREVRPEQIRAQEGASAAEDFAWKAVRLWAEAELAAHRRAVTTREGTNPEGQPGLPPWKGTSK